jgi:hypothetical protein
MRIIAAAGTSASGQTSTLDRTGRELQLVKLVEQTYQAERGQNVDICSAQKLCFWRSSTSIGSFTKCDKFGSLKSYNLQPASF